MRFFNLKTIPGWILLALSLSWQFLGVWARIEFVLKKVWPNKPMMPALTAIASSPWFQVVLILSGLAWIFWFNRPTIQQQATDEDKRRRAMLHIETRLKKRPGHRASYDAIRKEVNSEYDDNFIGELIDLNPEIFGRCEIRLKDGSHKQGITLVTQPIVQQQAIGDEWMPLKEAAQRLYEELEETESGRKFIGEHMKPLIPLIKGQEETSESVLNFLAEHFVQTSIALYGKTPPSNVLREIDKIIFKVVTSKFKEGASVLYLYDKNEPAYIDLSVKRSEVRGAIKEIKAYIEAHYNL